MPELPEVETVRRGLERLIVGRTIAHAHTDNPKSFPNSLDEVGAFTIGATVVGIRRRAKVLLIDLDSGHTLVTHLKMTGQLVYRGEEQFGAGHPNDSLVGELPDRSTRVTLDFADGSRLFFNDQRKFGWMKLYPSLEVSEIDFMKKVGPEPLEDDLTNPQFVARLRRRNGTTIKAALLDQTVVAGIGNIYADETLWAARIHPMRRVASLTDAQLASLLPEIRRIMRLAIEKGGSTDKNYVSAEGKRGSYLDFAKVFRRQGQPCERCGNQIVKLRVAGRGTHVCPVCQPAGDDI